MKKLFGAAMLVILATLASAQDTKKTDKKADVPAANQTVQKVHKIVCDEFPGRIVIVDSNGKWMATVRETTTITSANPDQPAMITCIMYDGLIRPSQPQTKTWTLASERTISAADFQQLIDALQTDVEAVKKLKKAE